MFIGGISPEGNGYSMEDVRIDAGDAALIPRSLIDICREGTDLLGQPERVLLESLLYDPSPPGMSANMPSVSVSAGYDVYPNIAEPAEWWRLGNLKTDGIDALLKSYRDETAPGMKMNRSGSIRELALRYGNINGNRLYDKNDLICRWMHQWGAEYTGGRV